MDDKSDTNVMMMICMLVLALPLASVVVQASPSWCVGVIAHQVKQSSITNPSMMIRVNGDGLENKYIHDNPCAIDHEYDALMTFITADQTEKLSYNASTFNCIDNAIFVHDAAELAGIRCGLVAFSFTAAPYYHHACVVFNATDRGPLYTDSIDVDKIIVSPHPGGVLVATSIDGEKSYNFSCCETISGMEYLGWSAC